MILVSKIKVVALHTTIFFHEYKGPVSELKVLPELIDRPQKD